MPKNQACEDAYVDIEYALSMREWDGRNTFWIIICYVCNCLGEWMDWLQDNKEELGEREP